MNGFNKFLKPENISKFPQYQEKMLRRKLREALTEFMLTRTSMNEYFALDTYARSNKIPAKMVDNINRKIIDELRGLGWTCTLSYGGTGLFIYSGDRPTSCWDGDL